VAKKAEVTIEAEARRIVADLDAAHYTVTEVKKNDAPAQSGTAIHDQHLATRSRAQTAVVNATHDAGGPATV